MAQSFSPLTVIYDSHGPTGTRSFRVGEVVAVTLASPQGGSRVTLAGGLSFVASEHPEDVADAFGLVSIGGVTRVLASAVRDLRTEEITPANGTQASPHTVVRLGDGGGTFAVKSDLASVQAALEAA